MEDLGNLKYLVAPGAGISMTHTSHRLSYHLGVSSCCRPLFILLYALPASSCASLVEHAIICMLVGMHEIMATSRHSCPVSLPSPYFVTRSFPAKSLGAPFPSLQPSENYMPSWLVASGGGISMPCTSHRLSCHLGVSSCCRLLLLLIYLLPTSTCASLMERAIICMLVGTHEHHATPAPVAFLAHTSRHKVFLPKLVGYRSRPRNPPRTICLHGWFPPIIYMGYNTHTHSLSIFAWLMHVHLHFSCP
jgi:hypothetical protein